jgi:hypothetical protein
VLLFIQVHTEPATTLAAVSRVNPSREAPDWSYLPVGHRLGYDVRRARTPAISANVRLWRIDNLRGMACSPYFRDIGPNGMVYPNRG